MAFAINDFFPCNLIENDIFLEIHTNTESTECDLPVTDIAD